MSFKTIICSVLFIAILYYGWPIFEALVLVLPLPDPKDLVEKINYFVSNFSGIIWGIISSLLFSQNAAADAQKSGYTSNLDAQIETFIDAEDEDSDEENDIGKARDQIKFDDDEEDFAINTSASGELIDLGSSSSSSGSFPAKSIPKLSGPK